MRPLGARTKAAIDHRLERLDQEGEVAIAAAGAGLFIPKWTVFRDARLARVRHADDDRLAACGGQRVKRPEQPPVTRVRRRRIEEVLPILHVDHRKPPGAAIGRRQIDDDLAAIAELWTPDVMQRVKRA